MKTLLNRTSILTMHFALVTPKTECVPNRVLWSKRADSVTPAATRCLLATVPGGTEVKSIVRCDHSSYNDITDVILLICPKSKAKLVNMYIIKVKIYSHKI